MHILGAGYAYPETIISNPFLAELSEEFAASSITDLTGIKGRNSVLSPTYLRETKNKDTKDALVSSSATPTELAMKAIEMALNAAGIDRTALGLILGDCSTPTETIPTEAHRIAKKLTLKIPSFDLFGSSASLCLALETLSSWKDDKLPDYILFVSTNTPTQKVDYTRGSERLYFGDAATALVLSPRIPGKLNLLSSFYGTDPQKKDLFIFDLFSHAKMLESARSCVINQESEVIKRAKNDQSIEISKTKWIGSQFDFLSTKTIGESFGIGLDNNWNNVDRCGNCLGSSAGCILAEKWDKIATGNEILITQVGVGFSFGYVLLRSA